jgi:hypothetical protein
VTIPECDRHTFSSLVHRIVAASSARQNPQSAPIEAALDLLRWLPADIPEIVVFDACPPGVSVLAEAWTFFPREGNAKPVIYVAGWSELYRKALADPRDRHFTIRLAGVLAHERGHIRHGADEEFAYFEQLTTLERLQAPPIDITNVRRALEALKRQRIRQDLSTSCDSYRLQSAR